MKKIFLLLFLVSGFISHSNALEFEPFGSFGSGMWWMRNHRFYDDTIKWKNVNVPGDSVLFYNQTDSFPLVSSEFLAYGSLGFKIKGDRFKSGVTFGIRSNVFDNHAGRLGDVGEQFYYKKYNKLVSLGSLYFEWYFNDYFTLLAGRSGLPTNLPISNQGFYGENSFGNAGVLSTGSSFMIQVSAGNQLRVEEPDGFSWEAKLAAAKVDTAHMRVRKAGADPTSYDDTVFYFAEVRVPKFAASFELNIERDNVGFSTKITGGFQRYYQVAIHDNHIEGKENTTVFGCDKNLTDGWMKVPVDAFVVGANIKARLGMFNVKVTGYGGQNVSVFGAFIGDPFGWWQGADYSLNVRPTFTDDDQGSYDEFLNGKLLCLASVLTVKPWDMLAFEGGIGTVGGFLPGIFGSLSIHDFAGYRERWDPTYSWYFNSQIKILEKLTVKPELGHVNFGPLNGFGKYTYWGFSTSIEF